MKVFKFGGASVKDAEGVKNITSIIESEPGDLIVVVSAMGKMTNAFEQLINAYFNQQYFSKELQTILDYHQNIIDDLNLECLLYHNFVSELNKSLSFLASEDYNFEYDKLIGFGELFSTAIIQSYFEKVKLQSKWVDVRQIIKTDSNFRYAKVDWQSTIEHAKTQFDFKGKSTYLTQGFIASDSQNRMTSLGREGSDYSAAILSFALSAESITIWKDVSGVLNADPRIFEKTQLLEQLSYYDAIELAFFGAQVIHPKTIQPLKNKSIPLYVKSFKAYTHKGTLVSSIKTEIKIPIVIIKEKQVLLSIKTRDFSFVDEKNISSIFAILSEYNAKVNMMLNGAVSFSIVIDYMPRSFEDLALKLSSEFDLRYNLNLELVTIRHYNKEKINEILKDRKVFLEQKSRNTAQYLLN